MNTRNEPGIVYVNDGQICIGVVERLPDGRWRAVARKREIGTFESRDAALAAVAAAVGEN
jgi:hypothetical protein